MNLEESLAHVKRLGDMPMADDHPPIESASKMVQYMHSQDSSFDLNAYISERFTYHNEEVKQITKLVHSLVIWFYFHFLFSIFVIIFVFIFVIVIVIVFCYSLLDHFFNFELNDLLFFQFSYYKITLFFIFWWKFIGRKFSQRRLFPFIFVYLSRIISRYPPGSLILFWTLLFSFFFPFLFFSLFFFFPFQYQ